MTPSIQALDGGSTEPDSAAYVGGLEPDVIVTVNGWLHDVSPREAHDAVCWPPHPREDLS